MRDLLLLGILFAFIFASFRVPYFMALGYLWVDFLQPQRLGYYIFNQLPIAMILGAGALITFLLFDREKRLRFGILQGLTVLLVAYVIVSSYGWMVVPTGITKLDWVTKALLFSAFLPMILTTRVRIEAALGVILFSISAITLSAGGKVLVGGGGYGSTLFLVNNNTGLYEGSTLATTSLAMIPLLWWFYKHNSLIPKSKLTFIAAAGITLSMILVTIGSEARTGLVAMAALAVLIWIRSSRKLISGFMIAMTLIIATPFLPETFVERMSTMETFTADKSASTRLAVWRWTLDYVSENPLGGGFTVYKINNLTVEMSETTGEEGNTETVNFSVRDRARAFHSSYFEMLGEQGYPGFAIWISLVIIFFAKSRGLVRSEKRQEAIRDPDSKEMADSAWAKSFGSAMSISIPVYMTGSLFVGIAFQPAFYHMIALMASVLYLRAEQLAPPRKVFTPAGKNARKDTAADALPGGVPAE